MKTNRRALHEALQVLSKIASEKYSIEALRCVEFRAKRGELFLTATDLDRTLTTTIPCEGELHTAIPCRVLAKLIKPESKRDDGDVNIEVADGIATVGLEGLTTKIPAIDSADFPMPSELEWNLTAMWPTKLVINALDFTLPAVCKDESRPHICCVALVDDKMVSTDGHRMHCAPLPGPVAETMLLPIPSAQVLQRILKSGDSVIVARSDAHVKIGVGNWTLESKLVDAEYPPYEQVIPRNMDTELSVDAQTFSRALKRVGTLSNQRGVRMVVNGAISLSSSDPLVGEAQVEVQPIENNHSGPDLVMGYNMPYLIDAIGKKSEEARLSMSGGLDPLRIDHPDGSVAVVMPMRL